MSSKSVDKLTSAEAEMELDQLAREIAAHDRHYYLQDAPVISDADYDALRQRNAQIEARFPLLVRPDSPSHRVGARPSEKFAKVTLLVPMLSLVANEHREKVAARAAVFRLHRGQRAR